MTYCNYITKTHTTCKIKYKEKYQIDNLFYCKHHYDILIKRKIKSEAKSNNFKSEAKSNNFKSEDTSEAKSNNFKSEDTSEVKSDIKSEDKFEVKSEDKSEIKSEVKSEVKSEDKSEDKSETKKKCIIDNCKKKCNIIYKFKDYCNIHYSKEINLEKKNIMNEVKNLKKIKITMSNKNKIKKDIFKLLLKIHPDKCTNPKINAHELTQDVMKIFESIR